MKCVKEGMLCVILVKKNYKYNFILFCMTCYNVNELFKGKKDEGLPQMDCGVDSSASHFWRVWLLIEHRLLAEAEHVN